MLERLKPEKTVDVYNHMMLIRSQCNYMVQTEDQYSFIHEALLEAVGCGNTEVPAHSLYAYIQKLAQVEPNTEVPARSLYAYIQKLAQVEPGEHVTGMELEFKVGKGRGAETDITPSHGDRRLANSKAHTSRFISANLPCNKFKNRLVNIMPYESMWVCLQPIWGMEGSDYINASFIDGYRQQKTYIATQGPRVCLQPIRGVEGSDYINASFIDGYRYPPVPGNTGPQRVPAWSPGASVLAWESKRHRHCPPRQAQLRRREGVIQAVGCRP
ncbi:Receptor-type tyrosine-protein phosphatase S [Myotis davidii]|uniref:protein-tyrosine-phosphatase n=1 Tax=Myotis davidii TaxID=225400 RepID=L5MGI8_MYODS|nr:Receptor-type tyrosine-protein phosphatase S [Myotis davidii]